MREAATLLKQCPGCGKSFAPVSKRHKYCSTTCRYRLAQRLKRINRQTKGLCPQCGGPMDYPVRIGRGKSPGATKISYCSSCREKFKKYHSTSRP